MLSPEVQEAIERLRSEMLHVPLCPIAPCTCQRFTDLALLVAAAKGRALLAATEGRRDG